MQLILEAERTITPFLAMSLVTKNMVVAQAEDVLIETSETLLLQGTNMDPSTGHPSQPLHCHQSMSAPLVSDRTCSMVQHSKCR